MQRTPWLILLLALFTGLVYVFLIPPWQHYDEPNHFEYVWLAAHRPGWPQEGDFDREMRVATLQSMIEHDFFRGMESGIPPVDVPEPWIGPIPQIGDAPLYYWLAAIPLRFLPPLEVTTQLYAARLVSMLLFLCTVLLAWLTTGLLVSETSPLCWMVPLFVATLPAFVDIMAAVNNDVAAIAAFTLFLYTATYLLVRGWRWQYVVLLFLSAGLCILAKRSVFFAILLIPVVLLFTILRGKYQRWAWVLFAVIGVGALTASLRYGDAAGWYRRTSQQALTRSVNTETPQGAASFQLQITNDDPTYQLLQLLPTEIVPDLAGETVTLGAWIWSDKPISFRAPRIVLVGKGAPPPEKGEAQISLETTPRFYSWTLTMPEDVGKRAWVQLDPLFGSLDEPTKIYIDGVILVVGEFFNAGVPNFQGDQVDWAGQSVENLLRDSSAENAWINPRSWVDDLWSQIFGYSGHRWVSFIFYTLRDLPGAGWYYRTASATLFRTFWAVFGWGHVDLLGSKPYRTLLIVTAILVLGGLIGLWKARRSLRWDVILVYALALGAIWGLTIVRGAHHVLSSFISIPVARYAFPALFPLAFLFAIGADTWQNALARFLPPLRRMPGLLWVLFLSGLTIWAWVSIYVFYY